MICHYFRIELKRKQTIYSFGQIATSLVMIMALLWLTVSTPFVYAADQLAKQEIQKQTGASEEEDNNPFSSTTEEKNESGASTISEYLHAVHHLEHAFTILTKFYKCHPSDTYFAFHPDLLLPPPKA